MPNLILECKRQTLFVTKTAEPYPLGCTYLIKQYKGIPTSPAPKEKPA